MMSGSQESEKYLNDLITKLEPHFDNLRKHRLYGLLKSISSVKIFMEFHVFAVWDFMSMIKSLQNSICCQTIPWIPKPNPSLTRLINSIVLDEESDVDWNGEPKSHFAMYLEAMQEMGVSTSKVDQFINEIRKHNSIATGTLNLDKPIQNFLTDTFQIINSGKTHQIAAAFTFGRENMIPSMFLQILNQDGWKDGRSKFKWYLERHVEVDGDEHGPAALKMVQALCGDNPKAWVEAEEATIIALNARNEFWSAIAREIEVRSAINR